MNIEDLDPNKLFRNVSKHYKLPVRDGQHPRLPDRTEAERVAHPGGGFLPQHSDRGAPRRAVARPAGQRRCTQDRQCPRKIKK